MNKTLILALLIMTISGCTPRLTGVGTPTPCKLKVEHYTLKKGKRIQVSTQTFDINDSLLSDEHGNQGTYNKYDAQGRLVQRLTTENGDTLWIATYKYKKYLNSKINVYPGNPEKNSVEKFFYKKGKLVRTSEKTKTGEGYNSMRYAYSKDGRISEKHSVNEAGKVGESETYNYGYDRLNRCISESQVHWNIPKSSSETISDLKRSWNKKGQIAEEIEKRRWGTVVRQFSYDAAGNMIRKTETMSNLNRVEYTYDAAGHLLEEKVLHPKGKASSELVHDFTIFQTWNTEGRLLKSEMIGVDGKQRSLDEWVYKGCEKLNL